MADTIPKKSNSRVGYWYEVTDAEIEPHRKKSIEEIFDSVEARFRYLQPVRVPRLKADEGSEQYEMGKR